MRGVDVPSTSEGHPPTLFNLSANQEEHLMRRMKKALLPLLFVVFSLGSGIIAAAQCDPYIISPSRGVCYLCGYDGFYCYYCCDGET